MLRPSLLFLTLVLSTAWFPAHAADKTERRCGWFEKPSLGNVTLTDRDGTWEIARQGGHQARGELPLFADDQWIRNNGHYGYSCACVTASVDVEHRRLDNLTQATARPLAACRNDAALHEPANPLAAAPMTLRALKTYQADGFSFRYPHGWKVTRENQCLKLDEPSMANNEEYTLSLCLQHGTLEQAADSLIFSLEDGVWMRNAGMDEPSPVDVLQGPGWKGLLTTQTCGVGDPETGFHAAGGTCLMAIVYTDSTQLLFETVGYYQNFETIGAIIRSVRFDAGQ